MINDNVFEYKKISNEKQLKNNDLIFSSLSFNEHNRDKCDFIYVHYDKKISMIFGVSEFKIRAPFSAPFGFIRYASDFLKYSHVLSFFSSLIDKVRLNDVKEIKITLPPFFYNESIISKVSIALNELGFILKYRDLNSHIDLKKHNIDLLPSSTKKAIRASEKNKHCFFYAITEEDKIRAYSIIKQNRDMKNYPLRMSWEQIKLTVDNIVEAEFFIVQVDGEDSAAAMVFKINEETVQVVYWGANQIGEKTNSMYFLPFELIKYYKSKGMKFMDIGPSSEFGIICHGLNDYKQMIGCINSQKETWVYKND